VICVPGLAVIVRGRGCYGVKGNGLPELDYDLAGGPKFPSFQQHGEISRKNSKGKPTEECELNSVLTNRYCPRSQVNSDKITVDEREIHSPSGTQRG